MSIFELVRLLEKLRFVKLQNDSAWRIQKCWLKYLEGKQYGHSFLSIFEIKKMIDKVTFIQ
jgi:hypothetical protein